MCGLGFGFGTGAAGLALGFTHSFGPTFGDQVVMVKVEDAADAQVPERGGVEIGAGTVEETLAMGFGPGTGGQDNAGVFVSGTISEEAEPDSDLQWSSIGKLGFIEHVEVNVNVFHGWSGTGVFCICLFVNASVKKRFKWQNSCMRRRG